MTREEWLDGMWRGLADEVDGAIARHERKGGQQCGPRTLDNVSLGALHYLRRMARDALEAGPEWYGTIDAKELRGGG